MTQENVGEKSTEVVKTESQKIRKFARLGGMTLDDALMGGMISADPQGDEKKERDARMEETQKRVAESLDNAG